MLGAFEKNIILIFLATSLVNICNLLYQLIIAHTFSPEDFAIFNAILSLFMIIYAPLSTIQTAVAKFASEFKAREEMRKVRGLFLGILKRVYIFSLITFPVICLFSFLTVGKLKIKSPALAVILTLLLTFSWFPVVLIGGMQGLELFKPFAFISVASGILKLVLTMLFIWLGWHIAGALGALLATNILVIAISFFFLKDFISSDAGSDEVDFKNIYRYIFPVAVSYFCYFALISGDMVLVKYFFSPQDSGSYALAQMVGKIFLFLPGAIAIVMFPRTSLLSAKNQDTSSTLYRSIFYAVVLYAMAAVFYNIFPVFCLKILTGKASLEAVLLGRLFCFSMGFFSLVTILLNYFLSKNDLRFMRYLLVFTLLQVSAIILLHHSLIQIQLILCVNAVLIFLMLLSLAHKGLFIYREIGS